MILSYYKYFFIAHEGAKTRYSVVFQFYHIKWGWGVGERG